MNSDSLTINGRLLREQREARGWAQADLAIRACLSVKQVRQLEEGGTAAFYSEPVKITAAKKVGALLGLAPEAVFVQPTPDVVDFSHAVEVAPSSSLPDETPPAVHATLETKESESVGDEAEEHVSSVADLNTASPSTSASAESAKPKNSWGLMVALFVTALAAAAWLRPEPEVVSTEPPPPLQAIATEATDPASAASAAVSVASDAASATVQSLRPTAAASSAPVLDAVSRPASAASTAASAK